MLMSRKSSPRSSQDVSQLLALPNEIRIQIIKNLDYYSLKKLCRTNKEMADFCRDPRIRKILEEKYAPTMLRLKKLVKFIEKTIGKEGLRYISINLDKRNKEITLEIGNVYVYHIIELIQKLGIKYGNNLMIEASEDDNETQIQLRFNY